jgi:Gluconate 2-dehydrogenase subunit 3
MTQQPSRRVTLAWIGAASTSAFATAGCETAESARQVSAPPLATAPPNLWKEADVTPIAGPGYGTDPHLTAPSVPWPLTLDDRQRAILRIAADLMLPADAHSPSGGTLAIDAFIDEWISAPYPQQQQDRVYILSGLAWLDAESQSRFGVDFTQAVDAQRRIIFDSIAYRDKVQPGHERPARFFARLRGLMLAGYYSLPEGIADIGYLGNTPSLEDYPGPTEEAMANLNASLSKLGLKPVSQG